MTDKTGIAVVIASVGRPVELGRWVDHVARQTLKPMEILWCVASTADLPPDARDIPEIGLRIIVAPRGSCAQRNAGLNALRSDAEIVAFFDDDYVPARDCMAGMAAAFAAMPEVVGLSGRLLADGINSPGISIETANTLIADHEQAEAPSRPFALRPADGLYGCNMAFRRAAIGQHRFDERLPLYGWQEDWDFAARVAAGRLMGMTDAFAGVHQGTKGGRTSGRRLGYSQIANPVYLYRKGSMDLRKALTLMSRNFLANHAKIMQPEPWVDRRGRAIGNWIAIRDVCLARVRPEHAVKL